VPTTRPPRARPTPATRLRRLPATGPTTTRRSPRGVNPATGPDRSPSLVGWVSAAQPTFLLVGCAALTHPTRLAPADPGPSGRRTDRPGATGPRRLTHPAPPITLEDALTCPARPSPARDPPP